MCAVSKVLSSHCRSNIYLLIGICAGISLSLFLTPITEDCIEMKELPSFSSRGEHFLDEYQPIINVEGKPKEAQKSPKELVRPRYYSTELGIRGKTFVGILTSLEHLHSQGIAINKTLAHLVDRVRYFISIPEGNRPNVSLPGIVGFTGAKDFLGLFHAVKYIIDDYMEDYDYYFITKDTTYVNARMLMELTNKISISQDVHIGSASEISTYCSLDAGILLSNSVLRKLKSNLDWCVKNLYSASNDINFGRCIVHSSSIPCSNQAQGQNYFSTQLPEGFNFESELLNLTNNQDFIQSVSVHPIKEHSTIYKFHAYFTTMGLTKVQGKIHKLRSEISQNSHMEPPESQEISWPIGNRPSSKPFGRFDLLRWTYFNRTHFFLDNDFSTVKEIIGSCKLELDEVLEKSVKHVKHENGKELRMKNLVNGYRKFDASRGMDYILDINFSTPSGVDVIKRIRVCKPLGKVEVLPVPYVTENSRLNMILTVTFYNKADSLKFMEHYSVVCMEKKDKTFLMVVLLYDPTSPSKGKDDTYYEIKQLALALTEKFKKDQLKVTWLSIRLPRAIDFIESQPTLKIAIADLVTKKLTPESLILFVETGMELKTDYLNRVRMNTIIQKQVFSPIPFVEFHPDIAYADVNFQRPELDTNRNYGRYDEYNFNSIGFYVKDYVTMRRNDSSVPIVHSDKGIAELMKLPSKNLASSIFEMFILYSELHSLRAVEPALKIKYKQIRCGDPDANLAFDLCMVQKSMNLGNRAQLAKLILEYQNNDI